jgi:DNA-binding response OmpR family regulator
MTAKPGKGHRVLVVGCEPALVKYFAVFLKIFGYQVNIARSFPEASRKAEKHPPDTLLGMALMPGMSGIEIGLRIFHQSQCSVLFVTASDEQAFSDILEQAREEGCKCMLLPLPFENSDLLSKVQSLAA